MPSKSEDQKRFIFAKRGEYKSKENTPKDMQWIWGKEWEKVEEQLTKAQLVNIQIERCKYGSEQNTPDHAKWIWDIDLSKEVEENTTKKRYKKFFKESLYNPGLEEAREFVFREYAKIYDKWISSGAIDKKPDLLPIIKKVTKKFNSYGKEASMFSLENMIEYYIDYRIKDFHGKNDEIGRKSYVEYFGLDTINNNFKNNIEHFIKYGN